MHFSRAYATETEVWAAKERPVGKELAGSLDGSRAAERMETMVAMSVLQYVLVGLAAVAGGLVNALAGGGTLITFPMLTAIGIPAVAANVTNTVALCPGYFGATLDQWNDQIGR